MKKGIPESRERSKIVPGKKGGKLPNKKAMLGGETRILEIGEEKRGLERSC